MSSSPPAVPRSESHITPAVPATEHRSDLSHALSVLADRIERCDTDLPFPTPADQMSDLLELTASLHEIAALHKSARRQVRFLGAVQEPGTHPLGALSCLAEATTHLSTALGTLSTAVEIIAHTRSDPAAANAEEALIDTRVHRLIARTHTALQDAAEELRAGAQSLVVPPTTTAAINRSRLASALAATASPLVVQAVPVRSSAAAPTQHTR